MKTIIDKEFVGFGVSHFDIPEDFGEAQQRELKAKGYQMLRLPNIQASGESREDMKIGLGVNLQGSAALLAELLVKRWQELPILLYTIQDLDGGITLCPFRFVEGTTLKTNAKLPDNTRLFVDLVEEERIRIL